MNILDTIIATKKNEVAIAKQTVSVEQLQQTALFARTCASFKEYLSKPNASGIIAEFKRQSPSKGIINNVSCVQDVAIGYQNAGVCAMSILTDTEYFGGYNKDVLDARPCVHIPIIRKEFIVDSYQIIEAKSIGADAILLIAACLSAQEIIQFTNEAHALGLEVLLELHDEEELEKVYDAVDMIGINNRNLKNFVVDVQHSVALSKKLPKHSFKIAESGLDSVEVVAFLRSQGFQGFLMGEAFMKTDNPAEACADFITRLQEIEK